VLLVGQRRDSVVSIGDYAFTGCSLTKVTIPDSVTSIGVGVFADCGNLTIITVDTNNPDYSSMNGALFNKNQTTLIQYPENKAGNYTIPNSITSIGSYAFTGCNLSSVTISSSIINIANETFFNCASLTNVTIPNSVTNIGIDAFAFCTSLTSVTIGSGVTSIAELAFNNCTSLVTATIPNSVTSIGMAAFNNCISLTGIYFQGNAPSASGLGHFLVFYGDSNTTVYYLTGTTGWGATFGGRPAVLWNPQALTSDPSFGVRANQFGFNITGSSNLVIVVETATNLANGIWIPLETNTLNTFVGTNGTSYFSDPQWTNYPSRFYRFRSP
jgi:hypothetical protein